MKKTFLIIATFGLAAFLLYFTYSQDLFMRQPVIDVRHSFDKDGFLIDTRGCRIPKWDPFEASVKKFFQRHEEPFFCPGRPSFLSIRPNAVIKINERILLEHYGLFPSNITCHFRTITRNPGTPEEPTDDKYKIGDSCQLLFDQPVKSEFILVSCANEEREFYTEYIPLTPLKEELEEEKSKLEKDSPIPSPNKFNIILLGIDSISKLNFYRHLPRTLKYLRETLGAIELHGYNKVGDNTFPNIVPLLSGHFISHYWNESRRKDFLDHVDLIWKLYAKHGYRTLMAEDAPNIATFNYIKRGFRNPPADYYLRPFSVAVERSEMRKKSKAHCFQSKMEMKVMFDYLKTFVETMAERPYFAFTFVARLTHDQLNLAGYADLPSKELLTHFHENGVFNNTFVLFFSDHGIRFGNIRKTYIGKFEERMPFVFLIFPKWFYEKYPEYAKNLHINERRLTTPFDLHATIMHLLYLPNDLPENATTYGISLLKEVPSKRSCEDAAIKPHWCTCQIHIPIPVNDIGVISAANALVDTLNEWTSSYSDKCLNLTLSSIVGAHLGSANDQVLRFDHHEHDVINSHVVYGKKIVGPVDYLITVSTIPGNALFEATVRYDINEKSYKVLDEVSRINKYGKQSECIKSAKLRKYCYCKNYKP
ncbi:uncharacterized protein LOC111635199 [Centruroides sculpturatus]|uniref:uncharacterized protein LOC111635199 n=1 Tax=Centruroides sculpturatus TaxID=218467 RepID=UPI000C6D45EB|nr:uncharacterized protein LOC111635199 [Centruroides sculpturatus]XP_023235861.1 uncharacterized protein LOC111635199 [Centruroides sculpturatus]XP_023235863.1 uncharacterized protein LOC111635199 [Centruroides sculpturatus]XP_023235864.1 uncharacterized protein LOC111635199 [Centruroides sculpturatus]XP_023235865.1 uncharacterized protein LOC111635199 [Centruroides sculpturatus]